MIENETDATLSAETLAQEQASITEQQLQDSAPAAPEAERPAPAAETEKKVEEEKVDPRAARMERLADKTHERRTEELEQSREAIEDPARPAPVVAETRAPERMIKLKVRGEFIELPESEVIARAQKSEAADTYLTEAKGVLEEAKKIAVNARPAETQAAPVVEQPKIDRLAKAIEQIQLGSDPAEVRALLQTEINEVAADAVRRTLNEGRQQDFSQNFDNDVDAGYSSFAAEHKEVAADPVARNVVIAVAAGLEGEIIAKYLTGTPDPAFPRLPVADGQTIAAFAAAGITPDALRQRYSPQDAHALFKDMIVKGFPFPRPSDIIKSAGRTVAERFGATTPARTTSAPSTTTPAPLDRTGRKEQLQQPERASIPRDTKSGQFVKAEPERATDARADMRSERRSGGRK